MIEQISGIINYNYLDLKMLMTVSGVGSSVQAETQSLCSVSISLSSKTLSESSEENLSDAEVDKSKRTFSRNLMTNSIQHQVLKYQNMNPAPTICFILA